MTRIAGMILAAGALALAGGAHALGDDGLEGAWASADGGAGRVELAFDGWDMLEVSVDGELAVVADYALEGGHLFITDIEGPGACAEDQATATYTLSQDPGGMTLVASGDPCEERLGRLDGRRFTRTR